MALLSASRARHTQTHKPTLQPVTGWALERAAALDRQSARGLLADIITALGLKRQAAFVVLATHEPHEIDGFISRIGADDLTDALRTRTARDILQVAFGTRVPMGYLRALARVGADPLSKPYLYRRLFEVFADPAEAQKAHVLRYCGSLHSSQIEAVDVLDPLLLDPEIIAGLLGIGSAHQLNAIFGFVRSICSSASEREIAMSFKIGSERWHHVAHQWLERADRFPEPPYQVPGLVPLASAREMAALGKSMRNCLRTKVGEVLLGLSFFYRGEVEVAGASHTPVVVEITPVSTGTWIVAGVYGPRHRSLPPSVVHRVVQPLLDAGALVCAAPRPEAEKLASSLGIRRWDEFRLPNIGDPEEEEFGTLFAGGDWAPV